MPSVSQLTREWCRKCNEETLHVCAHCNHCGTEHSVYKGPAFEHARVYRVKSPKGGRKQVAYEDGTVTPGCSINYGKNIMYGGVSDDMWQG